MQMMTQTATSSPQCLKHFYNFPLDLIRESEKVPFPQGRPKRGSRRQYRNVLISFDIETTRITEIEQSVLYLWQMAFLFPDGQKLVVFGRTWDEVRYFWQNLSNAVGDDLLAIYVHNLSYEFQFLSGIFEFDSKNVFALERRKVCHARLMGNLDLRCSYILSNMSLGQWAAKMEVEHQKLDGDGIYTERFYPWSTLPQSVYDYGANDVLAVVECLRVAMDMDGDTLATIPMTSTGYVRRDCRRAMQGWNRWELDAMQPNLELWSHLREAFRGGDTHANRYYSDMIINDVHSVDRTSSYPAVCLHNDFPVGTFHRVEKPSLERLIDLINVKHRACLIRLRLGGMVLSDPLNGFPYQPLSKSRKVLNPKVDNGRLLSCDYCEITVTDIDFKILIKEYRFEQLEITDLWYCRYRKLPTPLRNVFMDYFRKKTELKGVSGMDVYYTKSKNKLNSIYGCLAQNPVKQSILFAEDSEDLWNIDKADEQHLLESHCKRAFGCYQWGVWCTAWARWELRQMLYTVGLDQAVYVDTDSVKYCGECDWSEYNARMERQSRDNDTIAYTPDGTVQMLGMAEPDGSYPQFVTMGAKKYAYHDEDGKLHITVAGVNKRKGAVELERMGGLEAFREGTTFVEAGGNELHYNDHPEITNYRVDGHDLPITRNVVIRPSTYTLGLRPEYRRVLEEGRYYLEELQRIY